jgi:hypothetical protein
MKAIEFEATAEQHLIRIPDAIPDGTPLRVLVLMDDADASSSDHVDIKDLLAHLTEGLTEEDLHRHRDLGRGAPEWAI